MKDTERFLSLFYVFCKNSNVYRFRIFAYGNYGKICFTKFFGEYEKIKFWSFKMDCKKIENKKRCNCTYEPCPRKGICCDCIAYHLGNKQLPACCFPDKIEKTWDRSFDNFVKTVKK
ncbi:hypothetical protein OMAG_002420 [Candidatus Omnitrophus magneticus]|uniref:Cytosolic protein n=1 Tax=Candidatus Omnitrophus magneticus TaxID=1609969 RepID=A0A0F0CNX9_9BACT|nr:hypothetical protein OMAG_002420 [Candidatus Omnitrophus magneticus]